MIASRDMCAQQLSADLRVQQDMEDTVFAHGRQVFYNYKI